MAALKELYARGTELFEKGNYAEAERLLKEVIEKNSGYVDVLNKLGVMASLAGRCEEAAEHFRRALALNPCYMEAALNLTITYNDMGELEKAEEVFRAATKKVTAVRGTLEQYAAGKLANEHYKIGNIYLDNTLYGEAAEEYRKALRLRPDLPDVHTKLGIALRESGRFDEAIEEFIKAKESNPHYGPAWVQLGLLYYIKGHTGLAFEEWERALEENPGLKEARTFLQLFRGAG
jgi:tetratricopeptide (TPR) repeat protein